MEHVKEAEVQFKLAIEVDPKDAIAHYNYEILLYNMGHMVEAKEQYMLAGIDINDLGEVGK